MRHIDVMQFHVIESVVIRGARDDGSVTTYEVDGGIGSIHYNGRLPLQRDALFKNSTLIPLSYSCHMWLTGTRV